MRENIRLSVTENEHQIPSAFVASVIASLTSDMQPKDQESLAQLTTKLASANVVNSTSSSNNVAPVDEQKSSEQSLKNMFKVLSMKSARPVSPVESVMNLKSKEDATTM